MTRATLHISLKIKRLKVRVTGRLAQAHKMRHIFRTVRSKNFKVGVRIEDVDPHQPSAASAMTSKVKGQG